MGEGLRCEGGPKALVDTALRAKGNQRLSGKNATAVMKVTSYSALASCGAAIFAYIRASTHTRFMADDYCGAADRAQSGVLASVKDYYLTWDGRFASDFLNLVAQGWGPRWTAVLPSVLIVGWLVALYWALQELAVLLGLDKQKTISLTGATLLTYATLTSAPSREQSFFWETGLIVYGVPLILFCLYAACVLRSMRTSRRNWLALSGAIAFLAGGFSETCSVMQVASLMLIWILWRWLEKDERAKAILPGLFASVISFFIVAAAPGNIFRHKTFTLYTPDYCRQFSDSLLWTFYQVYRLVWLHPEVFALCLSLSAMAAYTFTKPAEHNGDHSPKVARLLLCNAAAFLVVFSSIAPAYFVSGAHPPDRAMAATQLFLLCVTSCWGCLTGQSLARSQAKWSLQGVAVVTMLLLVVGPVISMKNIWREADVYRVYSQMWDQQDEAIRAAKASGRKVVTLRPLPPWGGPGMESPGADPKGGFNVCIARYYGVDSVRYRNEP